MGGKIAGSRILVTGGAGFIGSHLAEALVEDNRVWSLDDYSTGRVENHVSRVEYLEGKSRDIFSHCSGLEFEYIFHLGEYARVEQSFDDYELCTASNLESFSAILRFAKHSGAKFVYSGSSTKFADDNGGPNASPYAWTKATNTEHLLRFADWFGLEFAIVYFYNVYGGRELSDGKFATLIGKYERMFEQGSRKLPVVLPGTQRRNFTHYSDVVSGLISVGASGSGDGFGIGSDESFSVLEVVDLFECEPEFLPQRKGNRLSGDLLTERTKALGWSPKTRLAEYIQQIVTNCNQQRDVG